MTWYYIYCEKRNTLFCHIEKNGCESLRLLVLKEENHSHPGKIWDEQIQRYLYNSGNVSSLAKNNPNVILISRDPYSRIISGFNDKVLGSNFTHFPYTKGIANFYNNDTNKRISFEEFINYITRDDHIDNHFRPQHHWLSCMQIFRNIKILKLENASEINCYLKELNFDNTLENYLDIYVTAAHGYGEEYRGDKLIKKDIPNAYKLHYDLFKPLMANNIIPLKKNYFTDELKTKFIGKYGKDFHTFNYSFDIKVEEVHPD